MQHDKINETKTVLVLEDSDFWEIVFSDLIEQETVELVTPSIRWKSVPNRILSFICRLHHSYRLNKIVNLPFKAVWNKYDYLYKDLSGVKRWIFTDTSVRGYDRKSLMKIKKQGAKLYMLFLNPISSSFETEYAFKFVQIGMFDAVFTVDLLDAKKYDFIYTAAVYSKKEMNACNSNWTVSYVGAAKSRLKMLHQLAELLQNTKSIFYITGVAEKYRQALRNVVYNQPMKYKDVLQIVNKSECIFEVVQDGQTGFTFRTYEAICYDKKLVTNNQGIINMEFYNPDYIKVFTKPDITILDFINNGKKAKYNYSGQYSPIQLYNEIVERERHDISK